MSARNSTSIVQRVKTYFSIEGGQLIRLTAFVIIFIMLLTFILAEGRELQAWRFYGTIIILTTIVVINLLDERIFALFRRELDGHLAFVILSAALMLLTAWMGHFINVIYLYFMIAAQAFITLPARTALVTILAAGMLYLLLLWQLNMDVNSIAALAVGLAIGLVFVGTLSVVVTRYAAQTRRSEQLAAELLQVNADLLAARQREAELAVAEERVRLAREIHDGLGHHLTVLNIQLQAAAKYIQRDPEKAAEVIDTCREEARLALDEIRQSVAVMRRTPLDGKSLLEALQALVAGFNRSASLQAELTTSGQAPDLPPSTSLTLYRVVQESLTNAQKHARNATRVWVNLAYDAQQICLTVRDDGQADPGEENAGGFGLAGLRERAEQLGGSLAAEYQPGSGFRIELRIPLAGGPS